MEASARKQFELQAQVRHNAEEFKNAISGLYNWTKDIKDKDDNLQRGQTVQQNEKVDSPIRSHLHSNAAKDNRNEILLNKNDVEKTVLSKQGRATDLILDRHAKANLLKDRGNSNVKIRDYNNAIADYTNAISIFPDDPTYYTNRALCYLKLEFYKKCIEDCARAIELNKLTVKAYYRRMQAYESLGNLVEALNDCTSLLTIDPKNIEAKRIFERINKRLQTSQVTGPSFSRSRPNLLDIGPVDKPAYKRSKVPLKRVQVTDIVGSKDVKNFENEQLDISDEDIDKLFNSNCGPFVEIKETEELAYKSSTSDGIIEDVSSNNLNKNHIIVPSEINKKACRSSMKEDSTAKKNGIVNNELKQQKIDSIKNLTEPKVFDNKVQEIFIKSSLPTAPQTTAQFYAIWKDLSPIQKYNYFKQVELKNIQKVTGAGFDSHTLTDILYVLRDYYLPNNETITAQTLYEVSKNDQVKILSLLMSNEDKQVFNDILNFLKQDDKTYGYAQKIAKNFGSSIIK